MRVALALAVALALVTSASAVRAGRGLTPAQAAQVRLIAARAGAERQGKIDRRKAAADKKKRIRDAKMAAALELAAEYKSDKARRKAERATARKREEGKRNAARLRFIEELLQERAARGR